MLSETIPARIFLDTCIVNMMLDFGEQIYDGAEICGRTREVADVEALRAIMTTGQRAGWQLAISPHTYFEVSRTVDEARHSQLRGWFNELWLYWRDCMANADDLPSLLEAENLRIQQLGSETLEALPDLSDRVLLCDAISYRCDLFCTRDWRTILKQRNKIGKAGIDIVTPTEWWSRIEPYAKIYA